MSCWNAFGGSEVTELAGRGGKVDVVHDSANVYPAFGYSYNQHITTVPKQQ